MSIPDVTLLIRDDHLEVNQIPIPAEPGRSLEDTAVAHITRTYAVPYGRRVTVHSNQSGQSSEFFVDPHGSVTHPPTPAGSDRPADSAPASDSPRITHPASAATVPTPAAVTERSFLRDHAREQAPVTSYWARLLHRGPSAEQQALWSDQRAISQHWPGPRTVSVINGKGGAGKTPTTILLSALLARHGGSGVLAWDHNNTRGTLGWRTEQGTHHATVLDLLPHTARLLTPSAQAADLAAFMHHQIDDKYDVLRSNPLLVSTAQKLTTEQLDQVHAVATKYYRITIMDSGNDEGDELWLRMIDHSDQLVVPTTTRADVAEAARLLLRDLRARDPRSARLADNAVVIVSQADKEETSAQQIADGFAGIARAVVTIPYDRALREQWLHWDTLAPKTQRGYLEAASAVARGL